MRFLAKLILTGALTVLPLLATGYVAFWLFKLIEESFGLPVKWAIGEDRYADGMGLAFAAVVFLLTGILMRTPPFRRLFGGAEELLLSIPVVKSSTARCAISSASSPGRRAKSCSRSSKSRFPVRTCACSDS